MLNVKAGDLVFSMHSSQQRFSFVLILVLFNREHLLTSTSTRTLNFYATEEDSSTGKVTIIPYSVYNYVIWVILN